MRTHAAMTAIDLPVDRIDALNVAMAQAQNLEPIHFDEAQRSTAAPVSVIDDWTKALPVLKGQRLMLRELVKTDSPSLLSMLSTGDVAKFRAGIFSADFDRKPLFFHGFLKDR